MIGAGGDSYNVCKGLKGRDLAYCHEQVDKCVAQKPTAGSENPYKLETCDGSVFIFSKLDGCVRNVPWAIEQRGSCPTPAAVDKTNFASAEDTGECDKYTGKEKAYCLEQVNECLDYKDRFSNETPISLYRCDGRGHFTFSSLLNCFSGVHFLIEQIGVCPPKKLKLKSGTAVVLTPSNVSKEISGTTKVILVRSLEDNGIVKDLNEIKPPWGWDESKDRPVIGRMAVIDTQTEDGKAVVKMLGLEMMLPVSWYSTMVIDGKFKPTYAPVEKE